MTNPMQPLDPMSPPGPITPAASPSDPAGYASVFPHGQGPAPYDIQAPLMDGEITAAFNSANAVGGAGFLYPQGPRQAATAVMMNSPQGFSSGGGTSGYDIIAGFHEGGGGGWPADVQPREILETPIQGQSSYPQSNTGTD